MVKVWDRTMGIAASVWLAAACSSDSCFLAGTLIATPRGRRPIESLTVGDSVFSYDDAGHWVECRVEAVHRSLQRVVCKVVLEGAVVRGVTPGHPFFDARRQSYRALRDLEPEAQLLVFGDTEPCAREVQRITIEEAPEPSFEVFNLTVSGEHNYVADGVLVHNKSGPFSGSTGGLVAGVTATGGGMTGPATSGVSTFGASTTGGVGRTNGGGAAGGSDSTTTTGGDTVSTSGEAGTTTGIGGADGTAGDAGAAGDGGDAGAAGDGMSE